jgi:hypothetical protein
MTDDHVYHFRPIRPEVIVIWSVLSLLSDKDWN